MDVALAVIQLATQVVALTTAVMALVSEAHAHARGKKKRRKH